MRFTKKLQPVAPDAESAPPAAAPLDSVAQLEAVVAGWSQRLAHVEAEAARLNSDYLRAARQQAAGETPEESPAAILSRHAALQIERDGIEAARAEATAKLAAATAERQQLAEGRAREEHLARYADLRSRLEAATAEAEGAWLHLAESLWRMGELAGLLYAPEFYPQQGGNAAGECWLRLRTIRGRLFSQGRRMNLNVSTEVVAIKGE